MANNTNYIILTDPVEIELFNALRKSEKLYKSFNSTNALRVYYNIITTIINSSTKEGAIQNINNMDKASLGNGDLYFSSTYDYTNINNSIEEIVEQLNNNEIYNKLNKQSLHKQNTNINNDIISTIGKYEDYTANEGIQHKLDELAQVISNTFTNYPNLAAKIMNGSTITYAEYYQSLHPSFKDDKEVVESNKNNVINIITGKNAELPSSETPSNRKYFIYVGYEESLTAKINRLVNEINSLYHKIVNPYKLLAESKFIQILNTYIHGGIPAVTNIDTDSNTSAFVDELISFITGTPDSEYQYTSGDMSSMNSLHNTAGENYNSLVAKNDTLNTQIQNKLSELETTKQQYKEENNGEDYQHAAIITTQQEGTYSGLWEQAVNIYLKQRGNITSIIVSPAGTITVAEGSSTTVTLSYLGDSDQYKPFDNITVTSSNTNLLNASINENTVTINGISDGSGKITVTGIYTNGGTVSKSINVHITDVAVPYYFYIGLNNNNAIVANYNNHTYPYTYTINTSLLSQYSNINEIAKLHNGSVTHVLLAEEWYHKLNFGLGATVPPQPWGSAYVSRLNINGIPYILIESHNDAYEPGSILKYSLVNMVTLSLVDENSNDPLSRVGGICYMKNNEIISATIHTDTTTIVN